MKVKIFVVVGHSLEAAMEGLEQKINEWMGESLPSTVDLKYSIGEENNRPYVTAIVVYG
jgi:hypothetical protein